MPVLLWRRALKESIKMCKNLRESSMVFFENSLEIEEELKFERALSRAPRAPRLFLCPITGKEFFDSDGRTIDWRHLSALVRAAVVDAGFQGILPWNISNLVNGGVAPGRYPRHASREGGRIVVKKILRFCGWLRAAAGLYALRRVIERTQSPNGMWSPRTTIHLWRLAARYPAPHALERKLWRVRARATSILAAYEGQTPSWASIAQALMVTDQTGKAALVAAALVLRWDGGKNYEVSEGYSFYYGILSAAGGYGRCPSAYRQARAWLVEQHMAGRSGNLPA